MEGIADPDDPDDFGPLEDEWTVRVRLHNDADHTAWARLRIVITAVIADNADYRRIVIARSDQA